MKKNRFFSILLSFALIAGLMPALGMNMTAYAAAGSGPVSFMDWDILNNEHVQETCTDYITVTSDTTDLEDGMWYVVSDRVDIAERINVNGNAFLILADGASLNAVKGIRLTSGKKLNIFAQSDGDTAGSLTATGTEYCAGIGGSKSEEGGKLVINGGIITANGGEYAAGIGGGFARSGGNVTINGGIVTANAGEDGAGIGGGYVGPGGNVTINGGIVTANGSSSGAGIGGGIFGEGGKVTINGGTVTASSQNKSYFAIGSGGTGLKPKHGTLTLGNGVVLVTSKNNKDWTKYNGKTRTCFMKTAECHDIVANVDGNGSVSVKADGKTSTSAYAGAKVTLTAAPDEGYRLGSINATVEYNDISTVDGLAGVMGNTVYTGNIGDYVLCVHDGRLVIRSPYMDYYRAKEVKYNPETRKYALVFYAHSVEGYEISINAEGKIVRFSRGEEEFVNESGSEKEAFAEIPLSGSGNTRTFTMPDLKVTVNAVFEEGKASDEDIAEQQKDAEQLKTTLSSVKAVKGRKAVVKWKQQDAADGYHLRYKAKGTKAKNVYINKAETLKKTVKKLKAGKKYSFRIRPYTNMSTGKKVYGKWSNTKTIKAKK